MRAYLQEREVREREEVERQKLARPSNMMRSTNVSDKDLFEAELIKDLMVSYFDIVRRNVLDTVPKSIMFFLVNDSKNRVQNELVASLYVMRARERERERARGRARDRVRVSACLIVLTRQLHRYKENLFAELLEEGPQVATRRQACQQLLDVLKRAHTILNEVRDMNVSLLCLLNVRRACCSSLMRVFHSCPSRRHTRQICATEASCV